MARRNRQGVLKRQRERKKAEKAELKRDERSQRRSGEPAPPASVVATADDLAGYGFGPAEESEEEA